MTDHETRNRTASNVDPEAATNFPTWMDAVEARITNKLFSAILRNPEELQIKIFDGEEFATHWTRNRKLLKGQTAQTDYTVLHIQSQRGMIGTITLVHGNGEDLISDASSSNADNLDLLETLCDKAAIA